MRVEMNAGEVIVTMVGEELSIVRYALSAGVDKLMGTARYFRTTNDPEAANVQATADRAVAARDALESAVVAASQSIIPPGA